MKLGMIGLGKMGGNMAERLRRHGHTVVGMDPSVKEADARTLDELVPLLDADGQPADRVGDGAAGPITDGTIAELGGRLSKGDIVIDGGNSNFQDSIRHGEELAAKGIGFIDCGTSGGVWGLENGYCLMVGGVARGRRDRAADLRRAGPGGRVRPRRSGRARATTSRWSTTGSSTG